MKIQVLTLKYGMSVWSVRVRAFAWTLLLFVLSFFFGFHHYYRLQTSTVRYFEQEKYWLEHNNGDYLKRYELDFN